MVTQFVCRGRGSEDEEGTLWGGSVPASSFPRHLTVVGKACILAVNLHPFIQRMQPRHAYQQVSSDTTRMLARVSNAQRQNETHLHHTPKQGATPRQPKRNLKRHPNTRSKLKQKNYPINPLQNLFKNSWKSTTIKYLLPKYYTGIS
jgi:hypothetical protein